MTGRVGLALAVATSVATLSGVPADAADGAQAPTPALSPAEVETRASGFALTIAGGADCDGSGAEGWRAHTFIVRAGTDISSLTFAESFPVGIVGSDYDGSDGSIRAPLHSGEEPRYGALPASEPKGRVDPSFLQGLDFTYDEWKLVDGDHLLGLACTDPTGALRQWWVAQAAVKTSGTPFLSASSATTPTSTAIVLSADPSTAKVGDPVTFTASVSPPAATGNVTFLLDGAPQTTVAVAAGKAAWTTSALTEGTKVLTATFAPTDPTAFTAATSAGLTYTVSAATATATSLSLTADPIGAAEVGDDVTLTASITPTDAPGTIALAVGGIDLAAPVTLSGGTATLTTTSLAAGELTITATYTPADPAKFAGSTASLPYTVTDPAEAGGLVVELSADPADRADVGQLVTFTAAIDPAQDGTVELLDGDEPLADPVEVLDGAAVVATDTLEEGEHAIVARFTPADETLEPVDSEVLAYTVGAPTSPDPEVLPVAADGGADGGGGGGLVSAAGGGSLPFTGMGRLVLVPIAALLVYLGRVLYLLSRPVRVQPPAA